MKKMIVILCVAAAFSLGLVIGYRQEKKSAENRRDLYKKHKIIVN